MSRKIRSIFIACFFACFSQFAIAADPLTPDATVYEFYKWYLHSVNMDIYPMLHDRKKLSTFVSKALIKEIDHGAGQDADYFTKAQDDFLSWENNIVIKKTETHRNTATVVVAIGMPNDGYEELSVILRKEGHVWRIRKIPYEKLVRPK